MSGKDDKEEQPPNIALIFVILMVFNCEIFDINEAKKLFETLGYYQIMNIKEIYEVYSKKGFELAIKYIEKGDILIEVETEENTDWDTIDKIKNKISKINNNNLFFNGK